MRDGLKIFSGNANLPLAQEIAKYIQKPVGKITISRFKDGEIYVRIGENVRGQDVFIVQPTSKYVNHNIMELSIIIDALRRASAGRITAVIPYYGYARQDRKARSREAITAKLVANLITTAGADRVLTLDLHSGQIQGFFDIPLDHLMAAPLLAKYIESKKLKNIVVVAPDAGGAKKARVFAKILKAPLAIIDKRREKHNEVEEMNVIGDVEGKVCVLIDDMIDTAGTIYEAAKALKGKKSKEIYVCATHGIFSEPALERLDKPEIEEVVITNTINHIEALPKKIKLLSVAPLLGEAIKRIHAEKSVSELFELISNKSYYKKLSSFNKS